MNSHGFTSQERHVLRQLWSIVATLDHRRQSASDLERQLAVCPDDTRRRFLLKDLLEARQAEEATILDLRDGVYHACNLAGPMPSIEE
jgi:DNA-directed RNA polymerase specialized sigma24 family protein